MSVVSVEKDVDGLTLTLVAEFDAPVERVWQLWADPRQLERWWGPPSHLLVHPLVVGDGLARLARDEPSMPLELKSAQTFKTGVLNLSYAPADGRR